MRRKCENRAKLGGEMWHNDHNISATTPTTYNTRLQHMPGDRDTVWGLSAPPKTAIREGRGEVRARAKIQRVGGSLKTPLNLTLSVDGPVPVAT